MMLELASSQRPLHIGAPEPIAQSQRCIVRGHAKPASARLQANGCALARVGPEPGMRSATHAHASRPAPHLGHSLDTAMYSWRRPRAESSAGCDSQVLLERRGCQGSCRRARRAQPHSSGTNRWTRMGSHLRSRRLIQICPQLRQSLHASTLCAPPHCVIRYRHRPGAAKQRVLPRRPELQWSPQAARGAHHRRRSRSKGARKSEIAGLQGVTRFKDAGGRHIAVGGSSAGRDFECTLSKQF